MKYIVVNKIGGSILKSPSQLKKTVTTILSTQTNAIVVVSALHGITDKLINIINSKTTNIKHFESIKSIHLQWLASSPFSKNINDDINKLQQVFHQLESDIELYKVAQNNYTYARIISTGERLASIIVNHYFAGEANIIFPENINLQTTNNPLQSEYVSNTILKKTLTYSGTKKYIIPGFYGINEFGEISLTGRGGSDYTAAFLASELSANELIFWKDSNGVQTANPQIVTNAENVADISLNVLNQMSHAGSKILHPKVTETLKSFNGSISFRNPQFGNQILTNIHIKTGISGKAIIIEKSTENDLRKQSISIITRNKTAALIAIQQLKNIYTGIQILDISDQKVTFQTRVKIKTEVIQNLHHSFYQNQRFSLQTETVFQNPLTL